MKVRKKTTEPLFLKSFGEARGSPSDTTFFKGGQRMSDERAPLLHEESVVSNLIYLDGQMDASLEWKKQLQTVSEHKEKKILWNLDLGLFDRLKFPLSNQMQCRSLQLALDQFLKDCWLPFSEVSLGVILYHGSLNFLAVLPQDKIYREDFARWQGSDEALHARDVAASYFDALLSNFPLDIPTVLCLDAASIANPLKEIELLHPDLFARFHIALKGSSSNLFPKWDEEAIDFSAPTEMAKVALCLPPYEYHGMSEWDLVLNLLMENEIHFRILSETELVQEWEGVDDLLFPPSALNARSLRKLQGFCAAGGRVIPLSGPPLGLLSELPFNEWASCKVSPATA